MGLRKRGLGNEGCASLAWGTTREREKQRRKGIAMTAGDGITRQERLKGSPFPPPPSVPAAFSRRRLR